MRSLTVNRDGMALEPMEAPGEEDDSELRDMTRRFWSGFALVHACRRAAYDLNPVAAWSLISMIPAATA